MNKFTKIILIASGICIVAGLAITAVAVGLAKKNPKNNVSSNKQLCTTISEDFSNLNVTEISNSIKILPSTDNEVSIEYWDSDEYVHDIRVEGDTLVVEYKNIGAWYEHVNINLFGLSDEDFADHDTIIYLPEGEYGNLDIDGVSSEVSIAAGYSFKDVSINSVSGSINLGDNEIKGNVNIDTTSGSISLSNAGGSADINTISGNVNISDSELTGAVNVDTTSGSVTLSNVSSASCFVSTVSGNMNFTNYSSNNTNIDTVSGSLNATLEGDYHITTDTVSGDISINCDNLSDGASFSFESTSGDLTLSAA